METMKYLSAVGAAALTMAACSSGNAQDIPLDGYGAPEWYDAHLIQYHTRMSFRQRGQAESGTTPSDKATADAFDNAITRLSQAGGSVLTRHIKSGTETPPWLAGEQTRAFVDTVLADMKRSNGHVIAYFWDAGEDALLSQHPDWQCQDRRGRGREMRRGEFLDLASPWGGIFGGWLGDLDKMGFSGAYLDANHFPRGGCYGSALEAEFKASQGGREDPDSMAGFGNAFQLFQAERLAEIVSGWHRKIDDPNFALIVSVGPLQTMVSPQMNTDLARAGIPKTEFRTVRRDGSTLNLFKNNAGLARSRPSNDAMYAAGLNLLASVSNVRPHVWIHDMGSHEDLLRAVGSTITNGGIANVDLNEGLLGAAGKARPGEEVNGLTTASLAQFASMDGTISAAFAGMQRPKFAAIHFSEAQRNAGTLEQAWSNVAGPVTLAYDRLSKAGVPVNVVDDRIVREGDLSAYDYVLTPDPESLTMWQKAKFLVSGTKVLKLPTLSANGAAGSAFDAALEPIVSDTDSAPGIVRLSDPSARATLWQNGDEFLVSIYTPSQADARTGGGRQSQGGSGQASARITLNDAPAGNMCVRDVLAGGSPARFDGTVRLQPNAPFQVLRFSRC